MVISVALQNFHGNTKEAGERRRGQRQIRGAIAVNASVAGPWAEAGDTAVRSDIEILSAAVVAGIGGWLLVRALRRTGVLQTFPTAE